MLDSLAVYPGLVTTAARSGCRWWCLLLLPARTWACVLAVGTLRLVLPADRVFRAVARVSHCASRGLVALAVISGGPDGPRHVALGGRGTRSGHCLGLEFAIGCRRSSVAGFRALRRSADLESVYPEGFRVPQITNLHCDGRNCS